jgi:hypothetical protein
MLILVAVAAVAVLQTKTYLESVVGNPPAWPLILKENKLFSWSVEISLVLVFFLNLVPVLYIRFLTDPDCFSALGRHQNEYSDSDKLLLYYFRSLRYR